MPPTCSKRPTRAGTARSRARGQSRLRLAPVLERLPSINSGQAEQVRGPSRALGRARERVPRRRHAGVLKDPPDSAAVAHLSAVPFYNSKLRTTCVATMMQRHAENALPQSAGHHQLSHPPREPASEVAATLRRLAADERMTLRESNTRSRARHRRSRRDHGPIEQLRRSVPQRPVVPVMEAARGRMFLRNPDPHLRRLGVFEEQTSAGAWS